MCWARRSCRKQSPRPPSDPSNAGSPPPCDVEEERVGIYYYLGLAHETMGDKDTALDFYDRVSSRSISTLGMSPSAFGLSAASPRDLRSMPMPNPVIL